MEYLGGTRSLQNKIIRHLNARVYSNHIVYSTFISVTKNKKDVPYICNIKSTIVVTQKYKHK